MARRPGSDALLATLLLVTATSSSYAQSPLPAAPVIACCQCARHPAPIGPDGCCPTCKKPKPPAAIAARKTCCHGCELDWSKLPASITPMPKAGIAGVAPTGAGYFSAADAWRGDWREKRPASGYVPFAYMPPSSFDADFRYVEKIAPADRDLVEHLKRIEVNDCLLLSTGGQFFGRFANEHNSRLTEADNSYLLGRTRIFGDLVIGDTARVFGEYLWADSFSEELPPLPIDVDRGDILNLFLDVNLMEYEDHPVFVRMGRQELLFGSQRLISTLDWSNVRRTFDAVRVFRRGEKWDFDAFFAQFVPANPSELDRADENQDLAGAWLTHRPRAGQFLDFYYLHLHNSNDIVQQGIARAPTQVHTLGTRWAGDRNRWLWDYELMLQLGEQAEADLVAGAATAGIGRNFDPSGWSPTAWLHYDYASGDADPTDGDAHTFNHLYPFGHYYMGWIDQVGRQNIHDLNAELIAYPTPWITCILQYHRFWLNQSRDALYNAAGVAIRRDATGAAGSDVGDEIDVIINFHLAKYTDVLVGYSHLFGGRFLEQTAGGNLAADAELFHMTLQQKW
jgi:hypothetical protein